MLATAPTPIRPVDPVEQSTEEKLMATLRPRSLAEYIGQDRTKKRMDIAMRAALKTGKTLEHVLLAGPAGTGKTTLANIVASEVHGRLVLTTGMALANTAAATGILMNLNEGDVLFVDEIHMLSEAVETFLYTALEDFRIDFVLGTGKEAVAMSYHLKPFTMIGATTLAGDLSTPLRERFGLQYTLEHYNVTDLASIATRSALVLGERLGPGAALEIGTRSRGVPRVTNRLLKRVHDYHVAHDRTGLIEHGTVCDALDLEGVDRNGLDDLDRQYLRTLIENYRGGPAGVAALAASMQTDRGTLENVIEPFLLRTGFLLRTPSGRIISETSREAAYVL